MVDFINNFLFIFERLDWSSALDLLLVTVIFSILLFFLRNTQAMVLVRGILFLSILVSFLIAVLDLPAFSWLVNTTLPALLLAIPVIFAPEIRRALERLGRAGRLLQSGSIREETRDVLESVVYATKRLSNRRHGALIVLERLDSLEEYISTGINMDSTVTPELIMQLFYPNTPMHDGAVIISHDKIAAAGCVMPLSSSGVLSQRSNRQMGLRHRAALGSSEVSDGLAIVVSEESGGISVATGGRMIQRLNTDRLEGVLRALYQPNEPIREFEKLISRLIPRFSNGKPTEDEGTRK